MCGFIYSTKRYSADSKEWNLAMSKIACRGPDQQKEHHDKFGSVFFARLAIIGGDKVGEQPFSYNLNQNFLIYNGEIYNFKELGRKYGIITNTDTEFLYLILRDKRYELLAEIEGMFAFVFFDKIFRQIISGRDIFGIKPLYWGTDVEKNLFFASTAGAIRHMINMGELDKISVINFLATGLLNDNTSPYKNIKKYPKGTFTISQQLNGVWEHNQIRIEVSTNKPTKELSQILNASIKMNLVSDFPVGVLLSSGIDSTLIAAIATQHVGNLNTFTLKHKDSIRFDESDYAKHNASVIGSTHFEVEFNIQETLEIIKRIIISTGEPFSDPAYIPLTKLCAFVARHNKVALAGEGADELFYGYKRYELQHILSKLKLKYLGVFQEFETSLGNNKIDRLMKSVFIKNKYIRYTSLLNSNWIFTNRFWPTESKLALDQSERIFLRYFASDTVREIESYRNYDLNTWLPNVYLEKSDRSAMLNGLEVRVPYLSKDLLSYSNNLTFKNTQKTELRKFLKTMHPELKFPKRKKGFGYDFKFLFDDEKIIDLIDYILNSKESILYDRKDKLKKSYENLDNNTKFRLLTLAIWQKNF